MNFVVIQERDPEGKPKRKNVARCAEAVDAILLAAALLAARPMRGAVQVWRIHKGQIEYALFTGNDPGPGTDAEVQRALESHRVMEQEWRRKRRAGKQAAAVRLRFLARFTDEGRSILLRYRGPYERVLWGTPFLPELALAGAADLGVFPVVTTHGEVPA